MLAFLSLLSLPDRDKSIAAFEAEVRDYLKRAEEINRLLESEKNLRKEGDEELVKARGTLSNKLLQFEALQKEFEALQSTLSKKQQQLEAVQKQEEALQINLRSKQ